MGHNIWDFVLAEHLSAHLAELEAGLLGLDSHGLEAALDVVEDAEVLAGLGQADHVHEAQRESGVSSRLTVNFDIARLVLADLDCLLAGEGIRESVAEQDSHGDALSQLVGAGAGARCVHTLQLVQAPVGGSPHTLHMLLWSSCL